MATLQELYAQKGEIITSLELTQQRIQLEAQAQLQQINQQINQKLSEKPVDETLQTE